MMNTLARKINNNIKMYQFFYRGLISLKAFKPIKMNSFCPSGSACQLFPHDFKLTS